jgi:ribA/ribD-fused uncharacterized protein
MQDNSPINIVEEKWHYLSPFSAHQISIWGELFSTVEHAYQSAKFLPSKERDLIKNALSPWEAWKIAQQYKNNTAILDIQFDKDTVMEALFRAKMSQHPDIVEILKLSGEREIRKNIKTDFYWGTGNDGTGKNTMGKLWMKLRQELTNH